MRLPSLPDPERIIDSAVTGWDLLVGPGVADLTRTPSSIIHEAPQCTVHRYRSRRRPRADRTPVLLVPPLAAPATCFDLRRGCSLAEHLTALGYPTYLVDYGAISFSDRALGLEHWVEDVIPTAVRVVSEDAGGAPVQPLGWCLGGILTLLSAAADPDQPIASIALVASPFDFEKVRDDGPDPPDREAHGRRARHRPLQGARRRARAAGQPRLPAHLDRPLPHQAAVPGPEPARPRDDRARRGGGRLHGEHVRLPGPHLRPALPRLLPRELARRRKGRAARGPRDRPGRRAPAGAVGGGRRRRAGAEGGRPPRGRAAAERGVGAARDGARRAPRRAHG